MRKIRMRRRKKREGENLAFCYVHITYMAIIASYIQTFSLHWPLAGFSL
jgi:hypothetical protein